MKDPERSEARTPEIARVEAHVHARRRPKIPGQWHSVSLAAVVTVSIVVLALAIRPPETPAVGANATPEATVGVSQIPSEAAGSPLISSAPSPEAVPTPQVADPTEHAPTAKPTRDPGDDPGPTDAPHPTWTPPPVFVGSATMIDYCFAADGTEQVMVKGEWDSPVPITGVVAWLEDGSSAGATFFPSGDYSASISSGVSLVIGTTHVATVMFYAGPTSSDLIATRTSAPFTVEQGAPCPTG